MNLADKSIYQLIKIANRRGWDAAVGELNKRIGTRDPRRSLPKKMQRKLGLLPAL